MIDDCWYKNVCTNTCTESCIRYLEMKYLMETSNIPKNRQVNTHLFPQDCDYDSFCKLNEIKQDIVNFVQAGKNIYIESAFTGNGKTTWAIKLLLKYLDSVWAGNGFRVRGVFINVPTFLTKLKNFETKDEQLELLKKNLVVADLVVWDDIGGSGMSAYDHSQLLTYIDQRVLDCKSNIYTGNLNRGELEKAVGTRLASRICNASEIVQFFGKDRRC